MAEDCVGSTYSVLSTMPSDSESSSSLSSIGTGTSGKAASPPPILMDTRQMSEKLEAIVFQLRQVTRERDELRKQLALSSPGSTFDDCRPSPKPSHDYERLKMQCMKAMSDLQSLQNQHTKTLKKCEEAVKEADFYHTLHSRLRNDQSQLKEEMEVIKRENTQLLREHNHVQQTCEELKRLHEEDQKEITDLRSQQQQVMRENGSSEILNKLYDTAMDKLEGLKKDYDALRKRYNEKIANHNTDLSRLERVEEENRRFQKQNEMLMKQTDAAVVEKTSIQQQYLSTLKRYDSIQHELSKATVQNKELQREMERLQTEVTRYKTLQLKAVKDAEKYKEERDTVLNEYRLVMSERDQVHKEIDKLQTELELAQGHLKNTSSERKVAGEELEALRQELHSALVERDHAICERNELLEKYCHEVKDKAEAQKELDQACKDIETVKEERDVARKERTEAIIQRDQLLREYYQARQCLNLQKQDSATLDMERASKEIEMLRKQCEAMSQELKEGIQEAEVAKRRRDWAFQERDKIVAERESIRTLCDNLRRERDRAVSDLAEALRDLDDMMKQKNDAIRELKELKEKMENQLEKEARIRQLMAHNSHDSAIDTDSLEWETEVVEFAKDRDDMDLKALGFDVAGGVDEPYLPGDSGIFVIKVDKGSIADGRLRVNDCLLRINDVDLTNKDRKHVIKAILNGGGVINMIVRRRKSLGGRAITPVHINLVGHKDIGISLETGVYVATVAPSSSAAREGSLTVGDRLITINGIALENKSLTECEALLRNCRDSVSLSLMKVVPQSSSWSGQNILETLKESEKSGNCRVHESEVQVPNTRNLKHNSSTQTDIFSTDSSILDSKNDRADHEDGTYCEHKQFSSCPLQPTTHRTAEHTRHNYSDHKAGPFSPEIFSDRGYGIAEHNKRRFTFDPTVTDCVVVETDVEKGHNSKHSGGTWPKTMVDVSPSEPGKLSIFKLPKQRKPIFDPDTFKRPQTPPKMDYLSPTQKQIHSSQSSKGESGSTPPTPPKRSDSFKFKHKQQTSSASDSTITTGSPPTSPTGPQSPVPLGVKQETTHETHDRKAGHYQPTQYLEGSTLMPPRTSEEAEGNQRVEEVEPVNRRRPKSAPVLRPSKLAPLIISGLSPQENIDPHSQYDSHASCSPILKYNTSEECLSLELHEWHRYTPKRSHIHSGGYVSTVYNGAATAGNVQRNFVPCPAVTAVLRNPNVPFFTVRSRMVHSANYPSVASQMCYPHPQHSRTRNHSPTESFNGSPRTRHRPQSAICFPESVHAFDSFSPQHHAHHSLDLTGPDHKHSSDLSESPRSTTPHGTQSLPASARIAGSSSSLAFAPSKSGRIRIPSNTRYPRLTTGSDRGGRNRGLGRCYRRSFGSERSSPSLITPPQSPMNLETSSFGSSQSQSSISSLTKISISPVSTGEHRKDRYEWPYLQEPRHVTVQKGTEPLGISIVSGENGGIFVSKVIGGSIAHQAGLEYGDQLLEYNGINLRNATEQQARLIIGQTEPCETITILAQYNPHMYQLGNHSRSSSRLEPISNHTTPQGSGATTPDNHSIIDAVSEQDEGTITPPSKQTTPTTSPRNSLRKSIDSTNQIPEPRFLFLKKTQMELGIQICGGNLFGVFVAKVEDDSPANSPDGLVPGDKLLEYNGTDMRNVTAEQAYVEMLKPAEAISVKAQYRIEEFNKVRGEAGDGFYIRALYDRVAEMEHDLSFKKDDILYVDDTLPQGNFGYWMAWQLDENAQKLERGQIPSKYMMDQEFCRRHSMSEVKDENGSVKTLSAAARRSFFRRKQKHKRNNSKDGKEVLALDAISTDSIPLLEDCGSLAYQRVQKIECISPRPVLILGPLVDAVKDMLVKDSSGKFCRCPLEVMKASQQAIERGVADYLFIDYKRRSGHFDVTTVASIKEITEKDCHCLLDIAPHAIERLHRIHIYPIVIFIRYKNLKQIKEQKDPIFLRDKGTQKKHSKEQFEAAQKIEQEYTKFFTGIVQGGSLPYICTQIMTIVDQEQNKVLWIPAGTL
ncbi:disks large homolog 5a isoform X1 [Carcharodon carcharias]|uniref:disks large homolog 5a isoform X1 n=1 Tax=Carcharodon carcharias TaxID=13397 RepID=UPI001B7E6EB1|nr:disks large homolog 5a isoform X1 [Carcharodon carcharias]XP_041032272.1 disks large homolog 5a isoform X1 [Carcharodon carcharias]XP_041032273.1 disks large homolog 5a isoform X1 [Carcharodon carcharias]